MDNPAEVAKGAIDAAKQVRDKAKGVSQQPGQNVSAGQATLRGA